METPKTQKADMTYEEHLAELAKQEAMARAEEKKFRASPNALATRELIKHQVLADLPKLIEQMDKIQITPRDEFTQTFLQVKSIIKGQKDVSSEDETRQFVPNDVPLVYPKILEAFAMAHKILQDPKLPREEKEEINKMVQLLQSFQSFIEEQPAYALQIPKSTRQ